jgi:hypothetical protein
MMLVMINNTINVYANAIGMVGVSPLVAIICPVWSGTRHRPADGQSQE